MPDDCDFKFSVLYKNIYRKKIHLSGLTVRYDTLSFTKTYVAAIIRHEKQTDMKNNKHLQTFSITAHYIKILELE